MEILEYIGSHWVEWLFAICLAILTAAWRTVSARLKVEHEKNEAIGDGVQSLLRDTIVTKYGKYTDKDKLYCPIHEKESLQKIYKSYTALGGNDIATGMYHELMNLPDKPDEGGDS